MITALLLIEMHRMPIKNRGRPVTLEYWYGGPTLRQKQEGCCSKLKLYEENSRFFLLAVLMGLYMLFGAVVFQQLEQYQETEDRWSYEVILRNFSAKYSFVHAEDLSELLWAHGNASLRGLFYERQRWDFTGSFYFVGTVVAAIGYGMTAPRTVAGKLLVVAYGFFGCAGAILFFNLFLERVITITAYILRYVEKVMQMRKRQDKALPSIKVSSDTDSISTATDIATWRPSVYRVWLCLFILAVNLVAVAALTYSSVEGWTYFEAVYYCFVSFATIGFGDYVASQQEAKAPWVFAYRVLHALFLIIGCSCIYSLFNVTSIIIRQQLNQIIRCLDCHCEPWRKRRRPYLGLGLSQKLEVDQLSEDGSSRRSSDGMISLKDFLAQNQLSMLMFQNHLISRTASADSPSLLTPVEETKQIYSNSAISASSVGPIAMLTKKFGE